MQYETPRLCLRWLRPDDLQAFLAYRSDPAVLRYQGMGAFTREAAENFIREQMNNTLGRVGEWQQLAIISRQERLLVGDCALKLRAEEARIAEIGYTINPHYQGQGLATEAVRGLLALLFGQAGVHKVTALTDSRNLPSIRVLEKLGFTREGHLRHAYYDEIGGHWADEYCYGMLQEEF